MSLIEVVSFIIRWRGPSELRTLYEESAKLGVRGLDERDFECFLQGAEHFERSKDSGDQWQFRTAVEAEVVDGSTADKPESLVVAPAIDLDGSIESSDRSVSPTVEPDPRIDFQLPATQAPPPATTAPSGSTGGLELYDWQHEALAAWKAADCRGVIEAVTGTGKTRIGIAAAIEELHRGGKVLVLVPTVDLLQQWRRHLKPFVSPARIGLLGDGHRDMLLRHDVLVAVVNSVRVQQLPLKKLGGLLIADECHRYGSEYNQEALDQRFERRLGLSATYARMDDGHLDYLDPYFGGTCFQMGYARAIADRVVAPFKVALVGTRFQPKERLAYDDADQRARDARRVLVSRLNLPEEPFGEFLKAINEIADSEGHWAMGTARAYLKAFNERRAILASTAAKKTAVRTLIPAIAAAQRTIVFTQTVDGAEDLARVLAAGGLSAGAIHSGLDSGQRRAVLASFASGERQVIVAPQVLDEGIDVPEADLAILVSASKTRRQMVQRMGRVLRRKGDGRMARFAVLFVEGTSEDPATGAHDVFLSEIAQVAEKVRLFEDDTEPNEINGFLTDWVLERALDPPHVRPFSPGAVVAVGWNTSDTELSRDKTANLGPQISRTGGSNGETSPLGGVTAIRGVNPGPGLSWSSPVAFDGGIIRTKCWFCGERVLVGATDADAWGLFVDAPSQTLHTCRNYRGSVDTLTTASLPRGIWAAIMKARAEGVKIRSYGEYARALGIPTSHKGRDWSPPPRRSPSGSTPGVSPSRGSDHWADAGSPRKWDECSSCGIRIVVSGGVDQCARCMTAG